MSKQMTSEELEDGWCIEVALDRIAELEAQLDAVRVFGTSHISLKDGEIFIKVRRDIWNKAIGEAK